MRNTRSILSIAYAGSAVGLVCFAALIGCTRIEPSCDSSEIQIANSTQPATIPPTDADFDVSPPPASSAEPAHDSPSDTLVNQSPGDSNASDNDTETDVVGVGDPSEPTNPKSPEKTTTDDHPPSRPASAQANQGACPPSMVEVSGQYCPVLMHQCIKGGATYEGQPSADPMPYHCDGYREGYAKCFGDELPMRFCIDLYEYPNEPGTTPEVFVSWIEAEQACEKQGKRLCRDDEWTLACEGPERKPYPYGWERDSTKCNIGKLWRQPDDGILARKERDERVNEELARLSQSVPSGSMPQCVSDYGVYDMTGNVDEWTINHTLQAKPYRSTFKGGHWCNGARNRCRPMTKSHDVGTRYYAQGFRCCADVPAQVTQP